MDKDLVQAIRARGVDVITALDAGMIERADEEHLDYATAQGRVLYSFNAGDFYRLHTAFLARGNHTQGSSWHSNSGTPWVSRHAVF
jgi:hypothetical protein